MKYYFTVGRGTWLSQTDFRLHWSTATEASCQRYKATSLSETTHSSFVFFQGSACIMLYVLSSVPLQMWDLNAGYLKIKRKKKTPAMNITELCNGAECSSLKSSVYQEVGWLLYCQFELCREGRGLEGEEVKRQHWKVPGSQLSQTPFL